MKKVLFAVCVCYSIVAAQTYKKYFSEGTMRVDYYHTGTKGQDYITLDKIYKEDIWPGSKTNLLDTLNLGDSFVTITDLQTNILLYSRGYSTLFSEWQTTDDALQGVWKTFHETVRFPNPLRKVMVNFFRRDKYVASGEMMAFRQIFSTVIDPTDRTVVNQEKRENEFIVYDVMINGPIEKKVDILILGDGYTLEDMGKFRKDVQHFGETLFSYEPFKKRKKDFNVRAMEIISKESGIDMPDINIWKNTALGTTYNTFGTPRYVLTEDNKSLRDLAGTAPYDFITILVNDNRYGGGGIFNLYTTSFTKAVKPGQEWEMDYVYVHEFGHCFGGLGDEYYSSQTSYIDFYPKGVEPWEPNVTRTHTRETLKWRKFLDVNTQVPTPWRKIEYDSIESIRGKLDRLADDYYDKRKNLLEASNAILLDLTFKGKVGAFEGAGYTAKEMYRPAIDCKMFALNPVDFDPVCSAAIEKMIDIYCK